MWGLGCLIWEVFNGPLKSPSSLKALGNVRTSLNSCIYLYYFLMVKKANMIF